MTIFGPDISSYESGMDVSRMPYPFVILKCTEGTYYRDSEYPTWLAQAKASHKVVIPYHFVKAESSAHAQAAMLAGYIIDPQLPVMLDIETEGTSKPDLPFVLTVADAMHDAGLNVRLAYLPRWYWEQIGSPDLTPLARRGIGVVSSAYPRSGPLQPVQGYAADGGDTGAGWAAYGGVVPLLWQFTDAGVEQQRVDFNAYRGTINQLVAAFGGSVAGQGGDVNLTDTVTISPGFAQRYPRTAPDGFTSDAAVSVGVLLEGAAIRTANNEHTLADVSSKLDQLLAAKPPVVDVSAVAAQIIAAIDQHLAVGVDVHAVATAVQTQLAQALSRTA